MASAEPVASRACPTCGTRYGAEEHFCPLDGARLPDPQPQALGRAPADPLIGSLLGGRYRILSRLGEGGMSVVYRARHEMLERDVAVKVLRSELAFDPRWVQRFRREARAASRVDHENIVYMSDFGQTDRGFLYLVMEFVEGRDLRAVLNESGTISVSRALVIAAQICDALDKAHSLGVVHCDLKPENVLLKANRERRDFVKVLDFGIARLLGERGREDRPSQTGILIGTPHYMAPEQLGSYEIDHRVDLYALGVILFELLTGVPPFDAPDIVDLLRRIRSDPAPPMRRAGGQIPEALEAAVQKCLAKDPAERFADAAALRAALGPVALRRRFDGSASIAPPAPDEGGFLWDLGSVTTRGWALGAAPTQDGEKTPSGVTGPGASERGSTLPSPQPIEDDPMQELRQLIRSRHEILARLSEELWPSANRPAEIAAHLNHVRCYEQDAVDAGASLAVVEDEIDRQTRDQRIREALLRTEIVDQNVRIAEVREEIADAERRGAAVTGRRAQLSDLEEQHRESERQLAEVVERAKRRLADLEQKRSERLRMQNDAEKKLEVSYNRLCAEARALEPQMGMMGTMGRKLAPAYSALKDLDGRIANCAAIFVAGGAI